MKGTSPAREGTRCQDWVSRRNLSGGEVMSKITTVGIDLAKLVFSMHGVDENGKVVLRKTVSRSRFMSMVAQWPACLIGMEACSGAHEWARRFQALGHTVRIMAPRFVTPYRKSGKDDGHDAEE